ncbi:hypothetical protein JW960_25900 [candidate division KSB1 bacterium]|nr:hypothetical protein [candidate division KSB1 bacterium]
MTKLTIIFPLFFSLLFNSSLVHTANHNNTEMNHIIVSQFKNLTRSTKWELVKVVKQNFRTFHPQGMVKIGEFFFLTSVETITKPQKLNPPQNGYDRTPGTGIGHLYKIDQNGNLVAQITLGEKTIYHPGGFDYDGEYLWIPVAEYRSNSQSIVYRVDPITLEADKIFHIKDHIGGVVHNTKSGTFHAVNWGSRLFYTWKADPSNQHENDIFEPECETTENGNHYIDYQDCHYIGGQYMLCSGLSNYDVQSVGTISFGGIELVDLERHIAIHQIPVNARVRPDLVMTYNPFYFETVDNRLRFYFMPEDDESNLYIYETITIPVGNKSADINTCEP